MASFQAGEAGGFLVRTDGFAYKGYLKPTNVCPPEHPRAALEKIASDIAYELDLPVPPVQLFKRNLVNPNEESRNCISLVVYPEQYAWGQIWDTNTIAQPFRKILKGALARCSGMIALDLWLGQTDRNNHNNAIYGSDPEHEAESGFLFIDFANTMIFNHAWEGDIWKTVRPLSLPQVMVDSIDKKVLRLTLDNIRSFGEPILSDIVGRMPDDFLPKEGRDHLLSALIGRREIVTDYVSKTYLI